MANRDIDDQSRAAKVALKIVAALAALLLGLAGLALTFCGIVIWGQRANRGEFFNAALILFAVTALIFWLAYFCFSRGVIGKSKSANPLPHESGLTSPPISSQPKTPRIIEDLTDVDKSELGSCPNCKRVIRLNVVECIHCRALFGEASRWKVGPLDDQVSPRQ
jgi:hypothetical protein